MSLCKLQLVSSTVICQQLQEEKHNMHIHTYVDTYKHTYIHTYIHTRNLLSRQRRQRSMKLGSTIFERNSWVLCTAIEIETSCEIECDDVQQEVEIKTVTPFRKKRHRQLMRNPQLYTTTQGNSPPLLFLLSYAFHIRLHLTFLIWKVLSNEFGL